MSFLPADKFPDRIPRKADAVILFEQVSPGKFERHSLATLDATRSCVPPAISMETGAITRRRQLQFSDDRPSRHHLEEPGEVSDV